MRKGVRDGATLTRLDSTLFPSQIQESFKVVERVLSQRDAPPTDEHPYHSVEYFCKWSSKFVRRLEVQGILD